MPVNTLPIKAAKRRYSGIQPQYFPRLHYFNRILNSDVFMVRDDVQFVRKHKYPDGHNGPSFQAHTPIKEASGIYLLSVFIKHDGLRPIYQTVVSSDLSWKDEHLNTLKYAYLKAPYFNSIYPGIEKIISREYQSLAELNLSTILWAIGKLSGLAEMANDRPTLKAVNDFLSDQSLFRLKKIQLGSQSQFYKNNPQASANEKIIGLCKEIGASEDFCGGTGVAAYVDYELFSRNGITIAVQDWQCPEYHQQFIKKLRFIPNLSIIDLLMNVPLDKARSILAK